MTGDRRRDDWRARRDAASAREVARRKASLFPDWKEATTATLGPPSHPLSGDWRGLYKKFRAKHDDLVTRRKVPPGRFISEDEFIQRYIAQRGRCDLTGREFKSGIRPSTHFTLPGVPSLDRIDQRQGYIPGNVRLVIFEANRARGDGSDEELIALCRDIVAYHRRRARSSKSRTQRTDSRPDPF